MNVADKQRALQNFVNREVIYCVSTLFHDLAKQEDGSGEYADDLWHLMGGYEECQQCGGENFDACDSGEVLVEVFEHWIVTDWLARELKARGERVSFDIHGLTVWGRQCTGQGIASDHIIERIYDDLHKSDEALVKFVQFEQAQA